MEMLAVVLLAVRNDGFGFAELVQHDHELATLDLLHLSREQLAHAAGELVPDPGPLTFADALDYPLLSRLHGRAPELGEVHRLFHHVADLELLVSHPRFFERYLAGGVGDFLDHGLEKHDLDRSL